LLGAQLVMEAQDRNPPTVLELGIEIDVSLVSSEHLAEATHADEGPRVVAHGLLEVGPESRGLEGVRREHGVAALALEAVPPDETGLAVRQVAEAGNVESTRTAVVEGVRLPHQLLHQAGHARPHDVLAEVVADVAARGAVGVGVLPRARTQQESDGLEGRRRRAGDRRCRSVALPVLAAG